MANRIRDYLDRQPDDDGDDDRGEGWQDMDSDEWECATVGEVRELDEDLDRHLKDYQQVKDTVRDLKRTNDYQMVILVILSVLFVLHLIWGK